MRTTEALAERAATGVDTTNTGNAEGTRAEGDSHEPSDVTGSTYTYLADGQNVQAVEVDELRIGPGETYDVIVVPDDRAYALFAEAQDRSGFTRGTLAPRPGMSAEVPPLRELRHSDDDAKPGRRPRLWTRG